VNGGVKHWGHAVSTDLLHWEQLPVMLYPDEPFDCHGAYSGSALVEDGTMYLYYTGNVKHPGNFDYIKEGRGHNVCLAVSKDGVTLDSKQCLLTNRDYPAGLTCHVRDPKVFAYEGRYYMVLGARTLEDKGEVLVLESTDKLRWTHINTLTTPEPFGYMWECPDLFCLDGQWYLAVSPQGIDCQNVYGCGWFAIHGDWRGDCTLSEFHELDAGFDYYAPQSFVDGNGRRIQIGWMGMPDADYGNAPTVAYGWQHCFTVPRVLTTGPDGTLLQNPVPELDAQRSAAALHAASGEEVLLAPRFDLTAAPAGDFCLTVAQGVQLVYTEQDCTCTLRFTDPALADGRTVRRAAGEDRLSHAVILTGRGDLTAAARFLAAAHVCEGTDRPCLRCRHCRKVLEGIHPDVIPVLDTEHKELWRQSAPCVRMCTSAPTRPGARYTSSLTAAS
jgi:beta-fructofuranosidase